MFSDIKGMFGGEKFCSEEEVIRNTLSEFVLNLVEVVFPISKIAEAIKSVVFLFSLIVLVM